MPLGFAVTKREKAVKRLEEAARGDGVRAGRRKFVEASGKKAAGLMGRVSGGEVVKEGGKWGVRVNNPAVSGEQYRLAQAVLSGRSDAMPKKVARDLVEKTPGKLRSKWVKGNPDTAIAEYRDNDKTNAAVTVLRNVGIIASVHMSSDSNVISVPKKDKTKAVKELRKWRLGGVSPNPEDTAAEMFDSFHGYPSKEDLEFVEDTHYHENLAALGVLVELQVDLPNGKHAEIQFSEPPEGMDFEALNPFWSSARSVASKVGGSAYSKLKKLAASRADRGRWIPYDTYDSEVRAQAKAGYLQAHGVEAKIDKVRVKILPPKYKFKVLVDREQLRRMFEQDEREKLERRKGSRGRTEGTKFAGSLMGYQIKKTGEGFTVPRLDPESVFDSLKEAKEFIKVTKQNPRKKKSGPIGQFMRATGEVGNYLDSQLGQIIRSNPEFSQLTFLCSNEEGTQLFIVGGDQGLDLKSLGIVGTEADKESIFVGDLTHVTYHTRKIFEGKSEEYDYIHKMGEKGGAPPVLVYDRVNKRLSVSGGTYFIKKPFMGTSPGIEH